MGANQECQQSAAEEGAIDIDVSPELNPVENVWQYMRANWLSNRGFTFYSDIVGQCCDAWNKPVDQPWTIMSIGLREWAHTC